MLDTLISSLTERLFSAVSGEDNHGRPPLPAFIYDGRAFNPRLWERDIQNEDGNDSCERYKVTYESPDHCLKLILHFSIYAEYPVLEWQVELLACGKKDTAEIDAFRSISLDMQIDDCDTVVVRRSYGCKGRMDDFQPRNVQLTGRYPDNHLRMDTDDTGASAVWLPYVNVDLDENYGFELGLGWPGNWSLDLTLDSGSLFLEAGMKRSRFVMKAGERFRCPSIYMMLRDGINIYEAQVIHRRFLCDCHSRKDTKGKNLMPMQSVAFPGSAGEGRILEAIVALPDHKGIQAVELCSGWNGEMRSTMAGTTSDTTSISRNLGNWSVNEQLYPQSLSAVSTVANREKLSFQLWLEILSASKESAIVKEHPTWFLEHVEENRELLLNLGCKEARDWALDVLNHFVRTEKVNALVIPTPDDLSVYWENNEKGTRQGAMEALFIQGWFELMDAMNRLFPTCIIYSSGNFFADFESISRCIPHFSCGIGGRGEGDYGWHHIERIANVAQYLPVFTGMGTVIPGGETVLSSCLNVFSGNLDLPVGYVPEKLEHSDSMLRLQELFARDFHLLENNDTYTAYQLHEPESGNGAVVLVRHAAMQFPITLELNQIDTRAKYTLEQAPDFTGKEMKGSELAALSLTLGDYDAGCLLFYSRTRKKH